MNTFITRLGSLLLGAMSLLASTSATMALKQSDYQLPDVEEQYQKLNGNPEFLGVRMGSDAPFVSGYPTTTHYQGVARSQGAGAPYLFITRAGDPHAKLLVVKLASRDTDGERLRSNRLRKSLQTFQTPPPAEDKLVATTSFDYGHAGGIQTAGDILAVPLESPVNSSSPLGKVVFFDVSNPELPRPLHYQLNLLHKAGVVGIVKTPDDRFLLAVAWGDGDRVKFFKSNGPDFEAPGFSFHLHTEWTVNEFHSIGGDWPTGKTSFQGLNLVRQTDGQIYLFGGRNSSEVVPLIPGEDTLHLFRINGWEEGGRIRVLDMGPPKHFLSKDISSPLLPNVSSINADFLAGVGTYVSPTGELLLYACEHYAWGLESSMRFVEFHHRDLFRPDSPNYIPQTEVSIPTTMIEGTRALITAAMALPKAGAWIELYDQDHFGGQRVMIDYVDRNEDDFDDFNKLDGLPTEGFNDRASSLRFYAPFGWKIRLYDSDHFGRGEPVLDLNGVGRVVEIPNLSANPYHFDNGPVISTDPANETRVTSVQFVPPLDNVTTGYFWELISPEPNVAALEDGPPVESQFGTIISPAAKTLIALNGTKTISIRVTIGNTFPTTLMRTVKILNAPPEIRDLQIVPSSERGGVSLRFVGADAGEFDLHDVRVDWSQGPGTALTSSPANHSYNLNHVFSPKTIGAQSDTFHVKIDLSDGDSTVQILRDYTILWNQNNAPVAVADSGQRQPNHTFKTRVATLLANDVDPEGDSISIVSVQDPSPAGSKVSIQGDWVIFTPPSIKETVTSGQSTGGFTYTIRDSHGATSIGTVRLTAPAPLRSQNLSRITPLADHSGVQVEFVGIPNRTYEVFFSSGFFLWNSLGRFSSGPTGSFSVTDLFANGGSLRFYRTQVIE